jgi:predicted phosphodiesterase
MLEQFFEHNNADVDIRHCRDQYMSIVEDGINFIAFHGDNALYKRKPVELVNEFRTGDTSNYVVVLSGHVHQFKMRGSAKNFMDITLGSVCSPDHFTRDQLGFSTTPSCMIGKKSPYWGFDFTVINLY